MKKCSKHFYLKTIPADERNILRKSGAEKFEKEKEDLLQFSTKRISFQIVLILD